TEDTADLAMALIIGVPRRMREGVALVRSGEWSGWAPTAMLGRKLAGKVLGIVGMGRIGQAIARRCHFGFGMKVLYANRSAKQMDFEAEQVSMLDLAARADVVVVAVPGSAETYHLIDDAFFAAMQSHAHFINIARGDVVKEAALIAALEQGQIGGAGLDVYEFEPEVPEALRQMDNVTLLPHLGTAALDVRTDMGMLVLDNLEAFFKGETPPNAL
ncbi:MAG: NAD(P)-dependent oxidoreductase, partial [Pseudomonadota bacterium]|nr:NAD(P)-dependent oxidoreductase [Pseudomonadota bacterium]